MAGGVDDEYFFAVELLGKNHSVRAGHVALDSPIVFSLSMTLGCNLLAIGRSQPQQLFRLFIIIRLLCSKREFCGIIQR